MAMEQDPASPSQSFSGARKGSKVYSKNVECESATPKGSNHRFTYDYSINLKSLRDY